jgi:hypothetical protein
MIQYITAETVPSPEFDVGFDAASQIRQTQQRYKNLELPQRNRKGCHLTTLIIAAIFWE